MIVFQPDSDILIWSLRLAAVMVQEFLAWYFSERPRLSQDLVCSPQARRAAAAAAAQSLAARASASRTPAARSYPCT